MTSNLFSYNLESRLAGATIQRPSLTKTNKYFSNQSGIRTRAEMSGTVNQTNIFLNDPQNLTGFSQVLEELPSVGTVPTATYTLGSQILSQEKSGTVLHLMADGHGSTRLLTDSTGAITNAFAYDAYGTLIASNAAPQTAYLYTGERFDSDLQQYYLRARYYNPTVGRFSVPDQVDGIPSDPLSLHKYAYTQNDPMNLRDPSGNETLGELVLSIGIQNILGGTYNVGAALIGGKLITEAASASQSIEQIEGQNMSPDVDTATIIVHGVSGHSQGWSKSREYPVQQNLKLPVGQTPNPNVRNTELHHDFYEFDWGGFSVDGFGLIPVKSVHQMALVHLQMAQMLIWMNGYANINIISHSWGTTLSYDLMNSGGIEMHNWVTMGSPLNHSIAKPTWNAGSWVNFFSYYDPWSMTIISPLSDN